MIVEDFIIIGALFFIIATVYSAAGFGGGSSYLAILALFGINFMLMKSIALLCNIVVVSGNLVVFRRNNLLPLRKAMPLVAISVSLAFIGGVFDLKATYFFLLLGISLLAAAVVLFVSLRKEKAKNKNVQGKAVAASGLLGLLSGLVGIGGGIFLSPVLHLLSWDNPKNIAATASFFILVNSIAGIAGHFTREMPSSELWVVLPLLLVVVIGGQVGSRLTSFKLQELQVKAITAALVFIAGIKILADHL